MDSAARHKQVKKTWFGANNKDRVYSSTTPQDHIELQSQDGQRRQEEAGILSTLKLHHKD